MLLYGFIIFENFAPFMAIFWSYITCRNLVFVAMHKNASKYKKMNTVKHFCDYDLMDSSNWVMDNFGKNTLFLSKKSESGDYRTFEIGYHMNFYTRNHLKQGLVQNIE